jgi:hypothetical protein
MKGPKIKPVDEIVPDAYHGTSKDNAEKIKKGGKFVRSTGNDQYLGDGVYFFDSSEWHAKDWARRRYTEIGVICAEIKLGKCLDLYNKEHLSFLQEKFKELQKKLGQPTLKDAVVINWIAGDFHTKIDTVRALHVRKSSKKIFPGSHFYEDTVIMICVKNSDHIISFDITYLGP